MGQEGVSFGYIVKEYRTNSHGGRFERSASTKDHAAQRAHNTADPPPSVPVGGEEGAHGGRDEASRSR